MLVLLNAAGGKDAPNQESYKSPVPPPYSSLYAAVGKYVLVPDHALQIAGARLRVKQLRAGEVLRSTAAHFWIAGDPNLPFPRPLNLLDSCKEYAKDLYTAAALAFTDYLCD